MRQRRTRIGIALLVAAMAMIAGAMTAQAYHGDCPPGLNLTPNTGFDTYVSSNSTSNSQSVCVEILDPSPTGSCNTFCGGVTVTRQLGGGGAQGGYFDVDYGATGAGSGNTGQVGSQTTPDSSGGDLCLRAFTLKTPAGNVGPTNIGVCSGS